MTPDEMHRMTLDTIAAVEARARARFAKGGVTYGEALQVEIALENESTFANRGGFYILKPPVTCKGVS